MAQKIRMSVPTLKLLRLLLDCPSEGLSGAAISKATGLGSGTMYPLLQRLEAAKWIKGQWEEVDPSEVGRPKRRFYNLTRTGLVEAQKNLEQYQISIPGVRAWA